MNYLPKQLTEEELEKLVIESIEELGAESMKDMGRIMESIMPRVENRADGGMVSKIVKEYFK